MYARNFMLPLMAFFLLLSPRIRASEGCGYIWTSGNVILCPGDSVELRVFQASDPFYWRDGTRGTYLGTDSVLVVTQPGHYIAMLDNGCASSYIFVLTGEMITEVWDTALVQCPGTVFRPYLHFSELIEPITWSDGRVGGSRGFRAPGIYGYTFETDCGETSGVIDLSYYPVPDPGLPDAVEACPGDPVSLTANPGTATEFEWEDGSTGPVRVVKDTGTYSLRLVSTDGCAVRDTVRVIPPEDCDCRIEVPNVFTPNGDGLYDEWRIRTARCRFRSFRLQVYDRWGKLVFETANPEQSWRAEGMPAGVYYWTMKDTRESAPGQEKRIGSVTVLR